MRKGKILSFLFRLCSSFLTMMVATSCFLPIPSFAQKFSVSFPIGSTVYQGSQIPMTVLIEGVKCGNTVIKCGQGEISEVDKCVYIYRSVSVGLDSIEVYIRKGQKLQKIGTQKFVVHERPMPEASIGGLKGGTIPKGMLRAQQGVGAYFYVGGNHWEPCKVESFNFIVLRNNKVVLDIYNEGLLFIQEVKTSIQNLAQGDRLLITNIKGCLERDGGLLKSLDFIID